MRVGHEVEVHWDGGTVTRYRRANLHNLRHVKLISETVDSGRRPDSMLRGCAVATRRPYRLTRNTIYNRTIAPGPAASQAAAALPPSQTLSPSRTNSEPMRCPPTNHKRQAFPHERVVG
jgi:hypothetical protein